MHSARYRRTEKTCSEYIEARDGRLCRILRLLSVEDNILFVCQELISVQWSVPFLYEVDHPPVNVGLCILHEEDVSPCVYIAQHEKSFLAKIPNVF